MNPPNPDMRIQNNHAKTSDVSPKVKHTLLARKMLPDVVWFWVERTNGAAHNPPATGDEARPRGELGRPSWSGSCACYAAKLSTLSGVEGQRSRHNGKAQPQRRMKRVYFNSRPRTNAGSPIQPSADRRCRLQRVLARLLDVDEPLQSSTACFHLV